MQRPQIEFVNIFINNTFGPSSSGETFPSVDPATERILASVAAGNRADVDAAVKAARSAFSEDAPWRTMDASRRGHYLNTLADLVDRDRAKLAALDAADSGKTYASAMDEVEDGVKWLRYFAGWCDKIEGTTVPVDGSYFTMTRREPLGVVGCLLPWNYPAKIALERMAVILACGCTLVLKPSEMSPLSALHLASLTKEAGFPNGVVNVVPGHGSTAGAALSEHMDVDKVSFTGSAEVGKRIMSAAASSNLKKVSLELGGKSPLIICADADLEVAAMYAHEAAMTNQGESCSSGSRTFVHASIYDQILEMFTFMAQSRAVGDPFDDMTMQGPQISAQHRSRILEMIETGKREGARLLTGGNSIEGKGFYLEPTVFADVTDDMYIAKEEIFGPVQCVFKFQDVKEAIRRANGSVYGLATGIFTKDIDNALRAAQSADSGTVWINCFQAEMPSAPFGGVKMSGHGREGGAACIDEYTRVKTVTIAIPHKIS